MICSLAIFLIKIKNHKIFKGAILLAFIASFSLCCAQTPAKKTGLWGDQGNGTYKNPILNADYSDPDVIKLGSDFYMICSDFHFMGMPVLHSKDLVNWTIISQIYNRLDIDPLYSTMEKYSQGSWAPAIRYHNNKFYVYFCTPGEGLYMSSAANAAGPWSPLSEVIRIKGWEDPCPFWDADGQAYLGHSLKGAGPIIIHKMSDDGKHLLDTGKVVYRGPTAEGTKIYKRNGYYYIVIPEGGVATGYETALRAKNIYGPYERKIVLEQGTTKTNGPHQGGLVELDSGESWFIHFQDVNELGRVCHLEPVKWVDDWPLMGVDLDGNGIGEPVSTWPKPNVAKIYAITALQTSDEFNSIKPGLQWQWNHNPVDSMWSLVKHKNYLSLNAMQAIDHKHARNTITQKLMGKAGTITTKLDADMMAVGQKAGLSMLGTNIQEIGLMKTDTGLFVFASNNGKIAMGAPLKQRSVYLRITVDLNTPNTILQYSFDNKDFKQLGDACVFTKRNYWKGIRPGLFSYNIKQQSGTALFDWFRYSYDGPMGGVDR